MDIGMLYDEFVMKMWVLGVKVVGCIWFGYDIWLCISVGILEEIDVCVNVFKVVYV